MLLLFSSVNSLSSTSVNRHSRNFLHDVASAPKEALLCRFPESAPWQKWRAKTPNLAQFRV